MITKPINNPASCSIGIEGWLEDEALMDGAILNDMGMIRFHTPSPERSTTKSISEMDVSDLEILAMYKMATKGIQCGTCHV